MQPHALSSVSPIKHRPALKLVKTKELPREDWLAVRKQGIGSSDAATAVGLNPYLNFRADSLFGFWNNKPGSFLFAFRS